MKLTDKQLWDRIEDLDWGGESKGKEFDFAARQTYGFAEYGTKGMKQIYDFARDRVVELRAAVAKYENENGQLEIFSDDGYNDLLWHVVGLGVRYFEEALNAPKLLENRFKIHGYEESFAYCFQKPEPPRSPKAVAISELTAAVNEELAIEAALINLTERSKENRKRMETALKYLQADKAK